jgi:hypothetical protein
MTIFLYQISTFSPIVHLSNSFFFSFFFVSSNIFYWYNWHIKTEQQRFYNRIKKQPKVFVLNEPNIGLIVFLYCRIKFIQVALNTTNHQVHSSLFTHYSRYSNFFFSLFVSQKTSDVWEAWSHTFWVYFKVVFLALNTDLNISNKIKKHLVFIKQPITSKKIRCRSIYCCNVKYLVLYTICICVSVICLSCMCCVVCFCCHFSIPL